MLTPVNGFGTRCWAGCIETTTSTDRRQKGPTPCCVPMTRVPRVPVCQGRERPTQEQKFRRPTCDYPLRARHGEKSAGASAGRPVPFPRPGVGNDPRRGRLAGLDRVGSTSDRRQRRAEQAEIDRPRAENQRLTGKLAQTQAALSIMRMHTSSWRGWPRARNRGAGRAGDGRNIRRVDRRGSAGDGGVPPRRPAPCQPLPARSAAGSRTQGRAAHGPAGVDPGRAGRGPAGDQFDGLRGSLGQAGLGAGAGRGTVLVLDVEHVPDRAGRWETRKRRRLATHPPKAKPELVADAITVAAVD